MHRLAHHASDAASKLTVRSALNPALWLAGIVGLSVLLLSVYMMASGGDRLMAWALFILAAIPILLPVGLAIYFALVSPESLQSEDFQLRSRSLQMIQGVDSPRVLDVVEAVTNPHARLRELAVVVDATPQISATEGAQEEPQA